MGLEILVVDDEEVFSSLLGEQLARRGFSVRTAGSGGEALELARAHPPDAILLDVLMPGIDGVETLRKLKADPRTYAIPIVICSVTLRGEPARIRQLLDMGAKDFVPKPCEPDALAAILRKAAAPD